jgi:hypothetical protein
MIFAFFIVAVPPDPRFARSGPDAIAHADRIATQAVLTVRGDSAHRRRRRLLAQHIHWGSMRRDPDHQAPA